MGPGRKRLSPAAPRPASPSAACSDTPRGSPALLMMASLTLELSWRPRKAFEPIGGRQDGNDATRRPARMTFSAARQLSAFFGANVSLPKNQILVINFTEIQFSLQSRFRPRFLLGRSPRRQSSWR